MERVVGHTTEAPFVASKSNGYIGSDLIIAVFCPVLDASKRPRVGESSCESKHGVPMSRNVGHTSRAVGGRAAIRMAPRISRVQGEWVAAGQLGPLLATPNPPALPVSHLPAKPSSTNNTYSDRLLQLPIPYLRRLLRVRVRRKNGISSDPYALAYPMQQPRILMRTGRPCIWSTKYMVSLFTPSVYQNLSVLKPQD